MWKSKTVKFRLQPFTSEPMEEGPPQPAPRCEEEGRPGLQASRLLRARPPRPLSLPLPALHHQADLAGLTEAVSTGDSPRLTTTALCTPTLQRTFLTQALGWGGRSPGVEAGSGSK